MKVALIHDYLTQFGGAERVLASLSKIFPSASVYTLLYDATKMNDCFSGSDIRPSFLNKLPDFIKNKKRWLLPFLPIAISAFDLSEYDLILSSSSAFSKGIRKKNGAIHICYCHSPTRFLWDYKDDYKKENRHGALARIFLSTFLFDFIIRFLQRWDKASAEKVDFWIANSQTTKQRIKKYYNKDSEVIYPPLTGFKVDSTISPPAKDYFLIVSRLSAYKKINLVVEAFNELQLPLVVVGVGSDKIQIEKMAGDNIKFTGFISDDELAGYYANCKAFILANEEDFGLVALEAASFGKPVLAYERGGATEWLEEGVSGEFFGQQTKESIIEGARKMIVRNFSYDAERIKRKTEQFNENNFQDNIIKFVNSKVPTLAITKAKPM